MGNSKNGEKKINATAGILIVLILIIAILLLFDSPLKNMLFPSRVDIDLTIPENEKQEIEIIIDADKSLSGYIIQDDEVKTGVVMVGDNEHNKEIKGFLSFDLSRFKEMDEIRIVETSLGISEISGTGNPEDLIAVNFYRYDYGNKLGPEDFAALITPQDLLRGELADDFTSPWSIKGYSFIRLNQHVKQNIENDADHLQYIIFMQIPTDNDQIQDTFQFQPATARISITYTE